MVTSPVLRPGRTQSIALGVAVGFGLACRLTQYAANTSLWHDEAFVALSITNKTYAALLGPLDWNEASPPMFLIAEKLIVAALGRSEYALRLLPLVAGLLGMAGVALLARQAATRFAGLWMVLMLAASEKLIVQSNEVKHFTGDFLIAVALTLAALAVIRSPQRWRMVVLWGLVGSFGLWLSYASAFVFAGTSLALALVLTRPATPAVRFAYLAANGAVAMSFAFLLAGPVRAQLDSEVVSFWADAFPPMSALPLLAWLSRASVGFFNYLWQPLGILVAFAAAVGSATLWRRGRRTELALLTLPIAFSLVAAALQRWPFGGNQHMVFAAPGVLLLAGEGLETMRCRLEDWRPGGGTIAVALFLVTGIGPAVYHLVIPRERHEARPVIQFLMEQRRPEDQLLIFCPAEFEFYTGMAVRGSNPLPDSSRRVWFVGTRSGQKPFPTQDLLDHLRKTRPLLLSREAYGAGSYLFGIQATGGSQP
jgi:hypothetical protein